MNYKASSILIAAVVAVMVSFAGINPSRSNSRYLLNNGTDSLPGILNDSLTSATSSLAFAALTATAASIASWYEMLHLDSLGLDKIAFSQAVKGWDRLKARKLLARENIITIADFSQPSIKKRLYVIDLDTRQVLFNTYVAHGRNTGKEQATNFSNKPSSYKSSPGFYVTSATYRGSNGYSLKLQGVERGINDNAGRRAIVMHGADYVNESYINSQGYIGRSQGCPAIPLELTHPIINTIKEGSCLFIYSPVAYYAKRSTLIR